MCSTILFTGLCDSKDNNAHKWTLHDRHLRGCLEKQVLPSLPLPKRTHHALQKKVARSRLQSQKRSILPSHCMKPSRRPSDMLVVVLPRGHRLFLGVLTGIHILPLLMASCRRQLRRSWSHGLHSPPMALARCPLTGNFPMPRCNNRLLPLTKNTHTSMALRVAPTLVSRFESLPPLAGPLPLGPRSLSTTAPRRGWGGQEGDGERGPPTPFPVAPSPPSARCGSPQGSS